MLLLALLTAPPAGLASTRRHLLLPAALPVCPCALLLLPPTLGSAQLVRRHALLLLQPAALALARRPPAAAAPAPVLLVGLWAAPDPWSPAAPLSGGSSAAALRSSRPDHPAACACQGGTGCGAAGREGEELPMPAAWMLCQSGPRQCACRWALLAANGTPYRATPWPAEVAASLADAAQPPGSKKPPAAVVDGLYAAQTLHTGAPETAIAPPPCVLRPQARRQLRPPQAGQCRVPQHARSLLPVALCAGGAGADRVMA